MSTSTPIIHHEGEGDRQAFAGGGVHTWKLLAEDTDGALFLFEDVMSEGKTTPLHLHPEAAEITYVLEGEITVHVDGVEQRVAAGGVSYVPKGVPHAFLVVSASAKLLTIQTPAVGQAFYRGASDPADDRPDTLDIPRLQASAQANPQGVQLLGPPPFAAAVAPA